MKSRLVSLIACASLLPALAGCGDTPAEPVPLSGSALAAVTEDAGAPKEALAREVDDLFTAEGIGETRAIIVMKDGKIAAERYGENYGRDTRFIGWSMSKTVTGVLVGMLVGEGRLRLDEPAPIGHWRRSGDPRGEIALRHLMQMRSGLRHEEMADPVYESAEVRMLFLDGRDDMAGFAEAQPLDHAPGAHYQYSTPTTVILSDIIARVLAPGGDAGARHAAVDAFLKDRLAGPLGLKSLAAEYDAAGTMIGGSMIWANARDWARFGEFLRHKGAADGAQIVPRSWVAFMTAPSPRSPDYGAQTWLNRASGNERDVLFAERGPEDLFSAVGHLGQYVMVSPSKRLTLVRLGHTEDEKRDALEDQLADIIELYPEG
jgi:CubicO group peptidase (beta-lactamase class C family)